MATVRLRGPHGDGRVHAMTTVQSCANGAPGRSAVLSPVRRTDRGASALNCRVQTSYSSLRRRRALDGHRRCRGTRASCARSWPTCWTDTSSSHQSVTAERWTSSPETGSWRCSVRQTALEDHAFRARFAALDIQKDIGATLPLRIGLNSGQVIAGEMGSSSEPVTRPSARRSGWRNGWNRRRHRAA